MSVSLLSVQPGLQSARSVWRQSCMIFDLNLDTAVAICTERVEAKACWTASRCCNNWLQSARSVWRQRLHGSHREEALVVAICTGRVEAKGGEVDG